MAFLEKFSADDRAFLVALPYRTGLWISKCDETGGDEAETRELDALETIVRSYTEDFCKSEFVEELLRATMNSKDSWKSWHDHLETIPDDCRRAIDMLSPILERKDIASLKLTLLEIADTVAKAFREEDMPEETAIDRLKLGMRHMINRLQSSITNRPVANLDENYNISTAERAAIAELEKAIRPEEVEGQLPNEEDYAA